MIQILLNGTINGLVLTLLALAFMVVYMPCRVFYIALAGVYVLVPYVTLACMKHGCPISLAIIAGIVAGIMASVLFELINHGPLERKQASAGAHLISSLGLLLVLIQIIALIWGNDTQMLRAGMDSVYRFSSLTITRAQLLGGVISVILLSIFYCWLRFSNLGLRFRAMADNPVQLALFGYNTCNIRLLAFAMSGFLAACSSLAVANDVGFSLHDGLTTLLYAIVAVIIGGNRSFLAPVLGGIMLGILRALVVWYLSARWQDAVAFLLLALFLFFRPQGILGRKTRLEAAT